MSKRQAATSPKYQLVDGIPCYAPELAKENDGFPADAFERLFDVEKRNFWFRARNRIVSYLVRKHVAVETKRQRFLEIGCGTGFVLHGLSSIESLELSGAEIFLDGLRFARQRLPNVQFMQMDARRLPFENEFDAIGMFDSLEHIEEDALVLAEIRKALKPAGVLLLTVPQHDFLWSSFDALSHHKRRYSRKDLLFKLKQAGFEIAYVGSFMTMLLPLMLVSRLTKKGSREDADALTEDEIKKIHSETYLPFWLNAIFGACVRIDEGFIRLGISLPVGGSLVAVAKRRD